MSLSDQLAAAQARRDKAHLALSREDRQEITLRNQIAQANAEADAEEFKARELDLARRMDKAREVLGSDVPLQGVLIEGFKDSYIVRGDGKAHEQWMRDMRQLMSKDKGDGAEINRQYALKVVWDWNGRAPGDDPTSGEVLQFTQDLEAHLTRNPGQITPVTNAAAALAGVYAAERKS